VRLQPGRKQREHERRQRTGHGRDAPARRIAQRPRAGRCRDDETHSRAAPSDGAGEAAPRDRDALERIGDRRRDTDAAREPNDHARDAKDHNAPGGRGGPRRRHDDGQGGALPLQPVRRR